MFDERSSARTFFSAPQSITAGVATFLEPGLSVLVYAALLRLLDEPWGRADLVFGLIVFALTFPGHERFRDRPLNAAVDIAWSWLGTLAVLLLCGWATDSLGLFAPPVLLTWAVLTPALHWCAVFAGRALLRRHARLPHNRHGAVIIGAGALGAKLAHALVSPVDRGIDVLGFFDDRHGERLHPDASPCRLGSLADVPGWMARHPAHRVYITLPLGSQPRIVALLEQLQDTTASVFFVPDVFGISIIQGRLQEIHGMPVVALCETPFTGTNRLVKRSSDVLLSLLILLLLAPLLALLALGVKLSSPGPVLFRQRRTGLDGEEIVVYKFRTMRTQDDGDDVPQAVRDDPRVTPFGAFLRRRSLDELPQFWNVLQGRMSIVGPRPHAVAHNAQYRQLVRAYMVRHKVRPGITGWAQVHGLRGETDTVDKMQQRVEYDLEYLRNWSLLLDLQIIARTVKLVFFDRHAY